MQALTDSLAQLEANFVELMRHGMEKFSRPLRHRILPTHHHATLFQNLEKVQSCSIYLMHTSIHTIL